MDSDTRRNIITYYMNFIVVALVGFVVNPLLLGALGPLMFGVWKSIQRYLDFATVADGRASQALKWVVASRASFTDEERRRDVGAAIIVWFRWFPAAALVAAGVTVAVPILIKGIPDDVRSAAYAAAAVLAANTVLAGLLAIPDSVLTGVNQGYKSMLVTTAVFVLSNGGLLAVAYSDWPLWSLAFVVLAAAALNAGLTWVVAKQSVRWWGVSRPTKTDIRRVFGYSSWTLGWVLVDKLLLASELIVISVMMGALAVTQYTFTSYVMQFVLAISLVTASGFMPKLGADLGESNLHAAAERARSVRHLVLGVAALGSSAVLAFNGAFVTLWAGAEQYLGSALNALLVICGLQLAMMRMDGQILDVTMRIAPKVLVGLLSSVGGIAAGCLVFAATRELPFALLAIILLRLISNVCYPLFVQRSIPGSAVPRRAMLLAAVVLVFALWAGPLIGSGPPLVKVGLTALWITLAVASVWIGLVPRSTVRAILSKGS